MEGIGRVLLLFGLGPLFLHYRFPTEAREFHFVGERRSWSEALHYCRLKHTDLASASDASEMGQLTAAVTPGYADPVWIGLQRSGSMSWRWSDPARDTGYRKWGDGQPNAQPRMCAAIYGFDILMFGISNAWLSDPCTHVKHFVCFDKSRGFVAVDSKLEWNSAQAYCRTHHTDLATVGSDDETGQIWGMRPGGATQLWIGLFGDDWRWTDGAGSSFRSWRNGKPDNPAGDSCTGMQTSDSRWDDYWCSEQHAFICEGAPRAKRLIVRVKIHSAHENMTAEITDHILQQLVAPWARAPDMKASWRRHANGEIFIREEEKKDERHDETE